MASSPKIRLVIFDMGDTLMYSEDDARAQLDVYPVDSMLDSDTQVQGEGKVRKLFRGVRELFDALVTRQIHVGIASLNDAHAYKWLGPGFFDLNIETLHFPITEAGDSHSLVKGIWVEKIISWFNRYVVPDDPIAFNEVVFVDDLSRCHSAVNTITPGVHCVFPTPHFDRGLMTMLEVIEELVDH